MRGGDITRLLNQMANEAGEERKQTYDQIITSVYQDLRRCAARQLRGERAATNATGLVHELYGSLMTYRGAFQDRRHFLSMAAREMRRLIIQHARRRKAEKRGGGLAAVTLGDQTAAYASISDPALLIDIDRAVAHLPPDQVRFTELHWYAGFTLEETAQVLGLTVDTAQIRWSLIKRKLVRKLQIPNGPNS